MSPTPTLKQILDALQKQVLVGRTYLDTARGLLNADPVLLQTAPTFFGMAIDGSLELAQMAVARLYDTTRNTMSVPKMLKRAEQEAGSFQRGSGQEVRKAIAECQKLVVGLEPVIASIGERRNGWLAHLDPNTIADHKRKSPRCMGFIARSPGQSPLPTSTFLNAKLNVVVCPELFFPPNHRLRFELNSMRSAQVSNQTPGGLPLDPTGVCPYRSDRPQPDAQPNLTPA